MTRRTSVYTLDFQPLEVMPGSAYRQLDYLCIRANVLDAVLTGSGERTAGGAYIMFRVANDTEAVALAYRLTTAQGTPRYKSATLSTGQGTNHRTIPVKETSMSDVKHTLKADGAAFSEDGHRFQPDTTGGNGHGLCACGALSNILASRAARKLWHKGHVTEMENPAPEKEKPVKKTAAKKAAAPAPESTEDEATEETGTELEFQNAAKYYVRSLGLTGAETVGKVYGVTATLKGQTLTLHGSDEDVAELTSRLPLLWASAKEAHRVWRKEDKTYSGIDKSRKNAEANEQRLDMENGYFITFMAGAADALAGAPKKSKPQAYKDGVQAVADLSDDSVL